MLLDVLLPIGLIVVVAKLMEGVLNRFGLSSIIAYTLAGVVLGPATGIVEPTHDLELFLELGIFVLFFIVGLDEIDVPGFVATMRGRYFAAAIISVVISLLAALTVTSDLFGIDLGLGLAFEEALALAGILSLSSLGLAAKVLSDSGTLKQPIGLKIFTIVIIAEIASLLVVGFTVGEHGHPWNTVAVLVLLGKIIAFVVLAWLLSAKVLPVVIVALQRVLDVPQLSFGLLIGGLFLVVVGAEKMGLHGTIGRCCSVPPCPGCPKGCATTSCPACAAPRRVSSSRCSSPRPDSTSTFPSRACRPQRLRPSCSSRWRVSSPAPSSEPTSPVSTHRSRSRPGSCPRASQRSPSCSCCSRAARSRRTSSRFWS